MCTPKAGEGAAHSPLAGGALACAKPAGAGASCSETEAGKAARRAHASHAPPRPQQDAQGARAATGAADDTRAAEGAHARAEDVRGGARGAPEAAPRVPPPSSAPSPLPGRPPPASLSASLALSRELALAVALASSLLLRTVGILWWSALASVGWALLARCGVRDAEYMRALCLPLARAARAMLPALVGGKRGDAEALARRAMHGVVLLRAAATVSEAVRAHLLSKVLASQLEYLRLSMWYILVVLEGGTKGPAAAFSRTFAALRGPLIASVRELGAAATAAATMAGAAGHLVAPLALRASSLAPALTAWLLLAALEAVRGATWGGSAAPSAPVRVALSPAVLALSFAPLRGAQLALADALALVAVLCHLLPLVLYSSLAWLAVVLFFSLTLSMSHPFLRASMLTFFFIPLRVFTNFVNPTSQPSLPDVVANSVLWGWGAGAGDGGAGEQGDAGHHVAGDRAGAAMTRPRPARRLSELRVESIGSPRGGAAPPLLDSPDGGGGGRALGPYGVGGAVSPGSSVIMGHLHAPRWLRRRSLVRNFSLTQLDAQVAEAARDAEVVDGDGAVEEAGASEGGGDGRVAERGRDCASGARAADWEDLTDEVWRHIMMQLDGTTVAQLPAVSRRFRLLAVSDGALRLKVQCAYNKFGHMPAAAVAQRAVRSMQAWSSVCGDPDKRAALEYVQCNFYVMSAMPASKPDDSSGTYWGGFGMTYVRTPGHESYIISAEVREEMTPSGAMNVAALVKLTRLDVLMLHNEANGGAAHAAADLPLPTRPHVVGECVWTLARYQYSAEDGPVYQQADERALLALRRCFPFGGAFSDGELFRLALDLTGCTPLLSHWERVRGLYEENAEDDQSSDEDSSADLEYQAALRTPAIEAWPSLPWAMQEASSVMYPLHHPQHSARNTWAALQCIPLLDNILSDPVSCMLLYAPITLIGGRQPTPLNPSVP